MTREYAENKSVAALPPRSNGAELVEVKVDVTVGSWLLAVAAVGCEARDVLPENNVDKPGNDGPVAAAPGTAPGVGVGRDA